MLQNVCKFSLIIVLNCYVGGTKRAGMNAQCHFSWHSVHLIILNQTEMEENNRV